jgi:hypothetical protein
MDYDEIDFEKEFDSDFTIPRFSTLETMQQQAASDQNQIDIFIEKLHQTLIQYEFLHIRKRAKSYDLFRYEEECRRYHEELSLKQKSDGIQFASDLIEEISNAHVVPQPKTSVVQTLAENYLAAYQQMKSSSQNILFPWAAFDDDVQVSCLKLIKAGDVDKCRAYLLGFFEAVSMHCIPLKEQTAQGQLFNTSAGYAIGRHPFCSYFITVTVGVMSLMGKIKLELLSADLLCTKLKSIIDMTTQIWLYWFVFTYTSFLPPPYLLTYLPTFLPSYLPTYVLNLSHFLRSWTLFDTDKLKVSIAELIKECMQHIIFMTHSALCQIFMTSSSRPPISFPPAATPVNYALLPSASTPVNYALTPPDTHVKVAHASLVPAEGVSDAVAEVAVEHIHPPLSSQEPAVANVYHPISSTTSKGKGSVLSLQEIEELCCVPIKFRMPNHEQTTPYADLERDFLALEVSRTPIEITQVAAAILEKVVLISR